MLEVVAYKSLAIIFSLLILAVALFSFDRVRSWSHPAVVFALLWFAMSFVPLVSSLGAPISPWGTLYILAAAAAFSAPSMLMNWRSPVDIAWSRTHSAKSEPGLFLFAVFICLQLGAVTCLLINLRIQGIELASVFLDPLGTANRYLKARYNHEVILNPFTQLGMIANYVGVPIGGLLVSRSSMPRNVIIYLFAFSPSLAHVLIYADKGTIFLCAAYFLGGVVVRRIRWGETALFTPRAIKTSAVAIAILLPLMIVAMVARGVGNWAPAEYAEKVAYYLRSYAFSHLYAFSDWFNHFLFDSSVMEYTDPDQMTWGFWTFMAIGQHIRLDYAVPGGYFEEYFIIHGVMQSNIYTMFRGLIYDFGVFGGLVFFAIFGWVSALMYRRMLLERASPIAEAYYIFLAGYIYTSYTISLTIWTTPIVAAVGVFVVLWTDHLLSSRRRLTGSGVSAHSLQ
jgi:oligosaccharide repeat unit polymerase